LFKPMQWLSETVVGIMSMNAVGGKMSQFVFLAFGVYFIWKIRTRKQTRQGFEL